MDITNDQMGVSINGDPQNGLFIREKKWMIWRYPHFRKPPNEPLIHGAIDQLIDFLAVQRSTGHPEGHPRPSFDEHGTQAPSLRYS